MNRLLIVDDEHHVVNWLVELFSSLDEDMELEIMKAYSGQETMEILKIYRVDVLLLDIQMPGLSGLEVANRTLTEWPATHIVFLTAYENFDYLYKANRLENTSYLLKTENDTAIVSKVKEVLNQIKKENEDRNKLVEASTRKLLLDHMMQQDYLRTLVHGNYTYHFNSVSASCSQNDFMPIDFSKDVYLFYTLFSGGAFRKNMYINAGNAIATCLSFVSSILYEKFHFCMLEQDDNSMLWFFQYCHPSQMAIDIPITNFLRNISEDFVGVAEKIICRTTINIFFEELVPPKDLCHITHHLQQYALTNIKQNEYRISYSTVVSKQELEKSVIVKHSSEEFSLSKYIEELSFYLFQKDRIAYMKLLSNISEKCSHRTSMHDLYVIQLYSSIALSIIQFINQYHLNEKLALKIAVYPLYYINDFSNWKAAFHYLTVLSQHLFSLISDVENSRNEQLISKVEKYVADNISKSLTISDVASCINYNATYVSRLYRQTRGISLVEYITQCRIKLATKLLTTTNESIQNIAYQAGFDTSQYFSIVFKKETGLSPRDFRNSTR